MRQLWLLTPVLVAAAFAPVGSITLILVLALALDVLVGVLLARNLAIGQLSAQLRVRAWPLTASAGR